MDDLLSEKEQIEQIRTWWSDYGNYVIAGIVLGALGLFGINYYQQNRLDSAYAASGLYAELTEHVVAGDLDEAAAVSAKITAEHPDSAYASQSRLAMARLYMDQNRDRDAADMLNDLLGSSANEEYKKVARLRLAKILLYQDKAGEAIELLGPGGDDEGAFAARYDELRGDAYVALERPDDAREAYRRALTEARRDTTVNQEFVQLKLIDLPVEAEPATDPTTDPATGDAPVDAGAETAAESGPTESSESPEAPEDVADAPADETGE